MKKSLLASLLFISSLSCSIAQQLTLFPNVVVKGQPYINVIANAPGGGYFMGSSLDHVNGTLVGNLARIDNSGQPVAGFKPVVTNGNINTILSLTDGKILLAGGFNTINTVGVGSCIRLEVDGTFDQTFTTPFSQNDQVNDIALQSDGKIIAVGNFTVGIYEGVLRLNSDGTLDTTFPSLNFSSSLIKVSVDSQNNIWISTFNSVFKLDAGGNLSSGFPVKVDGYFFNIQSVSDKLYIGGNFSTIAGISRKNMALINSDGTIDENFEVTAVNDVSGFAVKADGKVLVNNGNSVLLLLENGTFSSAVAGSLPERVFVDTNQNSVISGGASLTLQGTATPFIGRLTSSFQKDNTFVCLPTLTGGIKSIASYPDGRILLGGDIDVIGFNSGDKKMTRLNANGSLDLSFNPAIATSPSFPNFQINSIVIQPDETILFTTTSRLARLTKTGAEDLTFSSAAITPGTGLISGVKKKADKLFLIGAFNELRTIQSPGIIKLNNDGTTDLSFTSSLPQGSYVTDIAFQSTSKIVLTGTFPFADGLKSVVRLGATGALDNTFTNGSINGNGIWQVSCDSQDLIYVAGNFFHYEPSNLNNFVRLSADGILDLSFTPSIAFGNNPVIESLEILTDDKIVVGARQAYGTNVLAVVDATGNIVDLPFTHLGPNSSITSAYFNGSTLYLGGRIASEDSETVSGVAFIDIYPSKGTVTNLEVTRHGSHKADMTWTNNNTLRSSAIVVERSTANQNSFAPIATLPVNATSYQDTTLIRTSAYYYRVGVVNASSTDYSASVFVGVFPKENQSMNGGQSGSVVYPNPGTGIFYVQLNSTTANGSFEVQNKFGEVILKKSFVSNDGILMLDLTGVPAGVYLVSVSDATNKSQFRIVKN